MNKKISIGVSKNFQVSDLNIIPNLLGARHSFTFKGYKVDIVLPDKPNKNDWENKNAAINCWHYENIKNERIALSYEINTININVRTGSNTILNEKATGDLSEKYLSESEKELFDGLGNKFLNLLYEVFEYWIEVVRLVLKRPTFCNFIKDARNTYYGTYLLDSKTSKKFYSLETSISANLPLEAINKDAWCKVEQKLQEGRAVPIWQRYYGEAVRKFSVADYRGFILSLAISIETSIRYATNSFLSQPINKKYQDIVNTIPVSRLIQNWKKIGFNSSDWKKLENEIKSILRLMEIRNGIMHRGEDLNIEINELINFKNSVYAFILLIEKER